MGFARNYQVIWFFNNVDDDDGHVSTLSPEGMGVGRIRRRRRRSGDTDKSLIE